MLATQNRFQHKEWLEMAFRGDIPEPLLELLERREVATNVMEEMMTQWPAEIKNPLERLYDVHRAETELLYGVLENLFAKHLENHP